MKGLSKRLVPVFDFLKDQDILEEYLLIGGTALSLQIYHRLSEDLDFGKWLDDPSLKKKEVDWPRIEGQLKNFGNVETEVLDLYQVDFMLNEVKVSFYANGLTTSKEMMSQVRINNIRLADIRSIGTMKLEVMSRRNIFRDYYDIYAILKEGVLLKDLVERCGRYSKHRLKTKTILAIIADHSRFKYEEDFQLLEPCYQVTSEEIGEYIRDKIMEEYGQ